MNVISNNIEDSLVKRYRYKLFTNIIGFCISLFSQAIIPRGLGPQAYGNFNFLTNFFTQIVGFFDMGSSHCFYVKLSQRKKEFGLVSFYFYFVCLVLLIMFSFVFIATLTKTYNKIWLGQRLFYVYLAAGLGVFTWAIQLLNHMADAYGITVSTELAKVSQRLLGLLIILLLFFLFKLNMTSYFYYQYFILFFLGVVFITIIKNSGYYSVANFYLSIYEIKKYLKEFYTYCHSLFILSLFGLVANIFDRWILQFYGGGIQQGFYAFSYQIAAFCLTFTSAITILMMREFSIAYDKEDFIKMSKLFKRYIPLFYSITAYFVCFVAWQSDKIIYIIGGRSYREAVFVVSIMAFYPLHQVYGQLSGSVFFATGKTRLYTNIGIIFMLLGLPLTFFLIAPYERMGLNAGAIGLAVKMVTIGFFSVNTQLFFNTRLLKLSFKKFLGHQILSVGSLLVVAGIATKLMNYVFQKHVAVIPILLCTGILYTLLVFILVYHFPRLFGLKREDVRKLLAALPFKIARRA